MKWSEGPFYPKTIDFAAMPDNLTYEFLANHARLTPNTIAESTNQTMPSYTS